MKDLKGFEEADLTPALEALRQSCTQASYAQTPFAQAFLKASPADAESFRTFLNRQCQFTQLLQPPENQGLLTGYFLPELEASRTKSPAYSYPVYQRPPELIVIENLGLFTERARGIRIAGTVQEGTLHPYYTREQIESGALEGRGLELAWVRDPYALYFMHVQGSGRLVFKDGATVTLGYNGTNGYGYTSIGKVLSDQGVLAAEPVSMDSILDYLVGHPQEAQKVLWHNESFVFFQELPTGAPGPIGAQQVPLTPWGSLAVDPDKTPLGTLIWIETEGPAPFQKLVVAQDVGGAIKGLLRGDLYCGAGPEAGRFAGSLNAPCSFYTFSLRT